MRSLIPAVLLLFSSAGVTVHAQPVPAAASTTPAPVAVDTQTTRAASPAVGHAEVPASQQTATRVEPAADAEPAAVQERKRSRVVWFLLGAVAVLGIILAVQ